MLSRASASTEPVYSIESNVDLEFIPSGCCLLDCVLSGGWPLGRISNIVGDRCLSGDTIVSAQRGTKPRKMTMRTLFNRVKGNHFNRDDSLDTYLLADVGDYVGMAKMLDIVMSGEKTVYEIVNDKGNSIKATEDHRFDSADDGWICLSNGLTVGSTVKYWRGTRNKENLQRNRYYRDYTYSIPYHPFGQRNFVAGRDYKRLPTARLIIEAAINGLTLEEFISILRKQPHKAAALQYSDYDLEVHHLDGDCTNDELYNLQLVDPIEHSHIHSSDLSKNTRDIEFSKIVSITKIGTEETFDITMEAPYHNFIANNFKVHNSTGKTLLAIEAAANFANKFKSGKIFYREAEAAFDQSYAEDLGMPISRIDFSDPDKFHTVEDLFEDMGACLESLNGAPGLYIVDSLDALSDRAELEREIDKGTYGAAKPKMMSEIFRRRVRQIERSRMHVMIISQIRDKIGVTFGVRYSRSGGRALDFYASQIVHLAHIKRLEKTKRKQTRAYGVRIKAQCTKNKIGLPFRECEFEILFGMGIDDLVASIEFLKEIGKEKEVLETKELKDFIKDTYQLSDSEYKERLVKVNELVKNYWAEIDEDFRPPRKKY